MDKSILEKIVAAAVKMARSGSSSGSSRGSYSSEEGGPIAAALIRAAIDNEEVRKALLS